MSYDALHSKLFKITESLNEQSYEEALPYRCDFAAEAKKARRYSDAELFGALKDAIEASKVSANAGKYADQVSVYRKELQKRGFSIADQDKQIGLAESKLNEQDDEDEDLSEEPDTPEMDIPDEEDDTKAVTVDEPKEEDTEEELPQEDEQEDVEQDEPEKQYFGKSDDDNYFYLNKGEKGYYITDAEGKIIFPSGKDEQEEAPSDDVLAFISEAQKELDITEISADIFTRYFEPAINKEQRNRDEEEGYSYEDAEDTSEEQPEEDEFADEDDGEGNYFDTRKDNERPVPVESKTVKNKGKKLMEDKASFSEDDVFENTKYKPILVSGITEAHRDAVLDEEIESEIEDRSDHPQTLFESLHARLFELEDWTEIEEGKNNPGKRDGTGPYKASRQRQLSGAKGKRKLAGKACVKESVQELIHEVPGITKDEKQALQWALAANKIRNQWPKPAQMLSRLRGFDIGDPNEDGNFEEYTEADLKVDYLKYVLAPLAYELRMESEDEWGKEPAAGETNEALITKRWRVWQVGLDSIGEIPAKTMFAAVKKFADTPVHFVKGQGIKNDVGVYVGDNGHEYHAYLMGVEETKLDEGLSYTISTVLKKAGIPKGYYTYSNGYVYIRSPKTTKEEIEAALVDAGFEDIHYDSMKHAFKLTASAIKDSKLNERGNLAPWQGSYEELRKQVTIHQPRSKEHFDFLGKYLAASKRKYRLSQQFLDKIGMSREDAKNIHPDDFDAINDKWKKFYEENKIVEESKLNEVKFVFNNYEFDVELVDESESGTVININDVQTFEFSPEFTNLYKENGELTEDSLKELAQSALANLEEDFFEEIASAGKISEPEETDEEQWDEPVEEKLKEGLVIRTKDDVGNPNFSYLDIGHGGDFSSDYEDNSEKIENYFWYYDGDTLQVVKEDEENVHHGQAFPKIDFSKVYSGRYEAVTGKLSLSKPFQKRFLDIPNVILTKLQDRFPEAVYLYVFG